MRIAQSLLLALALPGCAALEDVARALAPTDRPAVRVADTRLAGLTLQAVTLQLDLQVDNPYAVPLPLGALDWALSSGGTPLLSGAAQPGTAVPAHGSARVPLEVAVPFEGLLAVLPGVRPGAVVPWEAQLGLSADLPAAGRVRLPLDARGELPVPAVPEVRVEGLRLDELSLTRASGTLSLGVRNTNAFACTPQAPALRLSLGGHAVADARLAVAGPLQPGATATVAVPLSFSPLSAGTALLDLLRGSSATWRLEGDLAVDTPWGRFAAPLAGSGTAPLAR